MIYLARAGRVFGPFSEDEFSSMRQRGELERFTWRWDVSTTTWHPLDPPPPPLVLSDESLDSRQEPARGHAQSLGIRIPPPPARTAPLGPRCSKHIEAICHDSHQLVSGVLSSISESGCSLVSTSSDAVPVFSPTRGLILNLLDPTTGESMNVRARFTSASRQGGRWHYRLQWDDYPTILVS